MAAPDLSSFPQILRLFQHPEAYDLQGVRTNIGRQRAEASIRLHAILKPLLEAGADQPVLLDLLAASHAAAQLQLLVDLLRAVDTTEDVAEGSPLLQ